MHIQVIPNRGSPPAIRLRESYREGGKVKKRTLLNLNHWPPDLLEGFKALLKGGTVVPAPGLPGGLHHTPRAAPRPCRRRPRKAPPDRARPHPRTAPQPLPRS